MTQDQNLVKVYTSMYIKHYTTYETFYEIHISVNTKYIVLYGLYLISANGNNLLTNHNWTVLYSARKARLLYYLEKFLYLQSALKIVNSVQEIKSYAFQ